MKHTQGAWKVDKENRVYGERADGLPIAQIFDVYVGEEEAEANKNMMLAAPLMYEALKDLIDSSHMYSEQTGYNGKPTNEAINMLSARMLKARNVLKAAEGSK